jgi:ABC-type branched-subunit amino acid transport system substrate-binding protein
MTNDMAGSGQTPYGAVTRAIQAYLASVNEEGGVCGRSVELLAEDDGYSGPAALERTKKLVQEAGVFAMIGGVGTEQHREAAAYLNDPNGDGDMSDGIPDLFVSSGWSAYYDTASMPWTVGFIPGFAVDGAIIGRYINAELAGKKVAVLYRDDDYGREYLAGVATSLGGIDKIVPQPFPPTQGDVSVEVGKVRDAGGEVVVIAATPEVAAGALTAAAAITYDPQWIVGYSVPPSMLASRIGGGTSAEQLAAGFKLLDGSISTEYLLSPIEDETKPEIVEHTRIMESHRGPSVSSLSVYGQAIAETLVWTLGRSCSNLTRAGLMQAVESTVEFHPSVMLPEIAVNLGESDHRSVEALQPVQILESGEVVRVGDVISLEASPTPSPEGTTGASPTPLPAGETPPPG